jgi:hypothetical protein
MPARPRLLWSVALAAVVAVGAAAVAVVARSGESPTRGPAGAVAAGRFQSLAWPTEGSAALVRAANGEVRLVFHRFSTHGAPELYVYVVPGRAPGGDVTGGTRLGRLRSAQSTQSWDVPASVDLGGPLAVVAFCEPCQSPHGIARLQPAAAAQRS